VRPEERRTGVGRLLLRQLARTAVERRCGRMEWSVLDWNTPARDFYFKLGAVAMDEWTVFRMTPRAFGALAREGPPAELPGEAV
jgi:GNAT superfamily N-acetyltransferase